MSRLKYPTYLVHYASPYYDPQWAHEYYMKNRKLKGRDKKEEVQVSDTRPHQGPAPRVSEYYKDKYNKKEEVKEVKPKQAVSSNQTVNIVEETTETSKPKRGTLNEKGQAAKKELRERINAERDQQLNDAEASKNQQLETAKTNKETTINTAKESLVKAKEERDKDINNHLTKMRDEIGKLSEQIKSHNLSVSQKKAIRSEILKLKDENSKKIEALDRAYQDRSVSLNSEIENAKTNYSSESASIRESTQSSKAGIREESKNKYNAELDKIYSNSEYLKPKKASKKSK